jgi:uncharacterized membrane protein
MRACVQCTFSMGLFLFNGWGLGHYNIKYCSIIVGYTPDDQSIFPI